MFCTVVDSDEIAACRVLASAVIAAARVLTSAVIDDVFAVILLFAVLRLELRAATLLLNVALLVDNDAIDDVADESDVDNAGTD